MYEEPISDRRGKFSRVYCFEEFSKINAFKNGIHQINQSVSVEKFTLRGIHFQMTPKREAKYVRVLSGAIYDVAVDLRASSETFLKWYGIELQAGNHKGFFLDSGFGHAILTLEKNTVIEYLVSPGYSPQHESGLMWNDRTLNIDWPSEPNVISDKDNSWPSLENVDLRIFD